MPSRGFSTFQVYGVGGWRLPKHTDVGNDGATLSWIGGPAGRIGGLDVDVATGELAHL